MTRDFSHRSREDLEALRDSLDDELDLRQRTVISVLAMKTGLMTMPWPLKIGLALSRLRRGAMRASFIQAHVIARNSQLAESLWQDLTEHMVYGKDAYDRTSAGGWCKRELDKFIQIAEIAGWKRPEMPGHGPPAL